jgi:hypothetical protein
MKTSPAPSSLSGTIRLKATELPRFNGTDKEDIDVWIEQVSVIYEASKCDEAELLRMIPLVLREEARKWFTRVYRQRRIPLNNWEDYKDTLRN